MNLQNLGEFGLIEHLRTRLPQSLTGAPGVVQGIGDDAAVLGALNTPIVTCDALIEGVHFRRDWTPPFLLGRKAMAVNLSDLAATGATPVAAFVALGISTPFADEDGALQWLEAMYDGLQSMCDEFHFTVAGGDTTRTSREIMISITMIGDIEGGCQKAGAPILRSSAKAGNAILVTGNLGDSAAGLFLLQHPEVQVSASTRETLSQRHFNPTPRLNEMRAALSSHEGSTPFMAALDLSDGLSGDAFHIAAQSNVAMQIETSRLPISPACLEAAGAARDAGFSIQAEEWALSGGEDYELLLCAAPESVETIAHAVEKETGTQITQIGNCFPGDSPVVTLLNAEGKTKIAPRAWTHF